MIPNQPLLQEAPALSAWRDLLESSLGFQHCKVGHAPFCIPSLHPSPKSNAGPGCLFHAEAVVTLCKRHWGCQGPGVINQGLFSHLTGGVL